MQYSAALATGDGLGTTGFDSRLRTMTYDTIKAKPTWYAGIQFRSRLEARWAVFFDALGIPWEYEPERFETSAGTYTPDFRIAVRRQEISNPENWLICYPPDGIPRFPDGSSLEFWVEVKGTSDQLEGSFDRVVAAVDEGPCADGLLILGPVPDAGPARPRHPHLHMNEFGIVEATLAAFMSVDDVNVWVSHDGAPGMYGRMCGTQSPPPGVANQPDKRWKAAPKIAAAYSAARNERFGLYPAA